MPLLSKRQALSTGQLPVPKADSPLMRLARLWALAGPLGWFMVREIRGPMAPGGLPPLPMIKPTEREKMAVRTHRCDWP